MTLFYSKTTNGFYDNRINKSMPDGVVEISKEKHNDLMFAQSNGKMISSDENGYPISIDYPEPSKEDVIKAEILILEHKITNRRLREALLTEEGKCWLLDIEKQIETLREGLQ